MAKRFHSENIPSINDSALYVVEIWDDDHVGSSTEFKVAADGFRLRPDGQNGQRLRPVVATELGMEMYIQNATHKALITDLTTSAEGRFKIKVKKDGGIWYVGNVLVDIGSYEDLEYPYTFTVKATDLGGLSALDYSVDDNTPHDGWETLLAHAVRCLDMTGLLEFGWSGSDIAISVIDNWYEDSMQTGNDKDPFALARCHHRAFYEIESGGKHRFLSAFEVLRQVAQRKGLVLQQSAGRFRFTQITAFYESTPRARHYDKDGTYLSNSADAQTLDISGQDTNGAKLAGGTYTWMAPLRSASELYKHRNWTNIIAGAEFDNVGGDFTSTIQISDISSPTALLVSIKVTRTIHNNSSPNLTPYIELCALKIQIGTHYLRRDPPLISNGSVQYGQPYWNDQDSKYYFHFLNNGSYPQPGSDGTMTSTLEIATPPMETTGDVVVNVNPAGFFNATTGATVDVYVVSFLAQGSIAIDDFETGTVPTDRLYKVNGPDASANSYKLELTAYTGDGPSANTASRLQVWTGTVWADSAVWTVGGSGDTYGISNLLLHEIMAGQKSPVRKMQHTIGYAHGYAPHMRIDDGSVIWAFLGGTFTARYNDWQGEWYAVAYSPNGMDVDDYVEIPSTGPIGPTGGGPVGLPGTHTSPGVTPFVPQFPSLPSNEPFVPIILNGSSGITTSSSVPVGGVTSIPLNQVLVSGAYQAGQVIRVVDPYNFTATTFTVSQTSTAGDTSIYVTGYNTTAISGGAFIVTPESNGTVQGIGSSNPGGTSTDVQSEWWSIFQQWWDVDTSLDPQWPFQADNVGFETDENAGNGSTAGLRFDGDGLQSFNSSSSTAGVKIGLDGRLYMANLDTGTGTDGLVIEGGYVKKKTLPSAGVSDHGALTGLTDDDHLQYPLSAGRSGGQTITGGTGNSQNLTLQSTSDATKGRVIAQDKLRLSAASQGSADNVLVLNTGTSDVEYQPAVNASTGASDAGKLVKLDSSGLVAASMLNDSHVITLVAVLPGQTVTQTAGTDFYDASWLVPDYLNGYKVKRVDYALTTNTSTTGSLTIGFRSFTATNGGGSSNQWAATFSTTDVRANATPNASLVSGYWFHAEVNPTTGGTLNGTVQGLLITIHISKY